MSESLTVTILGCGASAGVPLIGCDCAVCTSDNPKNRRTRVSILVETQGKILLIDTSPDLREQFLREGLRTVNAILYTHAHADHVHGIDDIRPLNYHRGAPIPAYTDEPTLAELRERFAYAFRPPSPEFGWYRPCLKPYLITPGEIFEVEGVRVLPILQHHGKVNSLGFRIGNFAYCTDVKDFPPESEALLEGLEVLIIDCLREEIAPTHAHRLQALEWVERFRPKRAILTHMSHDFEYDTLRAQLPDGVEPAHDGMRVSI
jgi:phosphoribosyl 1,2-cyclic phosphate phosphodiesterase